VAVNVIMPTRKLMYLYQKLNWHYKLFPEISCWYIYIHLNIKVRTIRIMFLYTNLKHYIETLSYPCLLFCCTENNIKNKIDCLS